MYYYAALHWIDYIDIRTEAQVFCDTVLLKNMALISRKSNIELSLLFIYSFFSPYISRGNANKIWRISKLFHLLQNIEKYKFGSVYSVYKLGHNSC